MSRATFTLGRKFGLLSLCLLALLTGVGAVVVVNLTAMRRDAERLREEGREQLLGRDLVATLEALGEAAAAGRPAEPARAESLVGTARAQLERFKGPLGADPSRADHQSDEDRLARSVAVALGRIESALRAGRVAIADDLATALAGARVLAGEAEEEAQHAAADLVQRDEAAAAAMIGSIAALAAALALAAWIVMRTIVRPIRALRAGAERFGSGDLTHRIGLRRRDEIGDLALAFDAMADRVAATHGELRQQVERRTRELLRAVRLADLGTIAAGVAHEINNPLASIASCAEGLQRRLGRGEVASTEQQDYLGTIASEAYRAKEITGRLLALARDDQAAVGDVDLMLVCQQVKGAVQPLLDKRGIALDAQLPSERCSIRANAGELVQIMINLILNARDASKDGSTIRARCRLDGGAAVFEVEDEGHGIAPEHKDRIFDPFFTTKQPGEGTGLGLAMVAALVEARGGSIDVQSTPGKGSVFCVRLPQGSRR